MKEKNVEKLKNELGRIKLCHKYLNRLRKRKILYESELSNLQIILESELKDIQTLEKIGLRSLFHKTFGEYNSKLEKEKQEYLKAVVNYNKCERLLSLIDYEINILKEILDNENLIKTELIEAIKSDSNGVLSLKADVLKLIDNIEKKLEPYRQIRIEIEEAIILGNKINSSLHKIKSGLENIEHWGNNKDTNLKDIDKIQITCYQTELLLSKFEEELNDVLKYLNIELEDPISRMVQFNSIYIENLIADWIISKKIINGLAFICSLIERIDRIINILESELGKTNASISTLESNRSKLIDKI